LEVGAGIIAALETVATPSARTALKATDLNIYALLS
jgi:hypothetical protein